MIATISGKVSEKQNDAVIIELGGIGYEVVLTTEDWGKAKAGELAKYYIYEHIREDTHVLYGFSALAAKRLYTQLLGVSGVGPKVAMQVLSAATLNRLQQAIATGDPELLKGVSGVGKKTAERIVVELKGKIEAGGDMGASSQDSAYQALIGLGYSAAQAAEAAAKVPADVTDAQERIKLALKQLS
ncbi:MAG TPA: Holliday junction branch migration protein RuvA [Candidatus Dormibacteraeota bacterium]|nr:Holliday junction branch migration protein RuvA [Candidatus Dormibacteraeota bacterium]